MQINQGQRIKVSHLMPGEPCFSVNIAITAPGLTLDFACFGVDAAGELSDDRYMTFFNQPNTPCGGVALRPAAGNAAQFSIDLTRLPKTIERLVLTAALDGNGTMAQVTAGQVSVGQDRQPAGVFTFAGQDFKDERALILVEFYRKEGTWRMMASGQGFNGGLDALVRYFGSDVAAPAATGPVAPALDFTKRLNLEKRIAVEAPHLIDLTKKATISLEKVGLGQHKAKVCLCLDISASMSSLYSKGLVQAFAERILALGCRFDDDGEIDVFLFGINAHQPDTMTISNSKQYVPQMIRNYPLEGGTRYAKAMEAIRQFYFPHSNAKGNSPQVTASDIPVYVMFVTDGDTSDTSAVEAQVRASSYEPLFWQFMGIGKSSRPKQASRLSSMFGMGSASIGSSDFPFLDKLDNLSGRLIDNANFFSVSSPDEYSDAELYDLLMGEYPGWLKLAKQKGLLR
ncbi:MAG: VWA domain-containing protein [Agitococcus sp.]|nr:VWA domain-containing protein [Agitococcus sp.]